MMTTRPLSAVTMVINDAISNQSPLGQKREDSKIVFASF